MKKMYKDAVDAINNMSPNELADMLEKISPETYIDLEGSAANAIISKAAELKPFDTSHSLHVYEERFEIDDKIYAIYHCFGEETKMVSQVVKTDFSRLREQEPTQLSLF